jgi:hypothetical protein
MSEEIELAAKTTGEVVGAVTEVLMDKSGVMEPVRALARALTTTIDALFYPILVRLSQRAAAQIAASQLPRRAVESLPPRLLRGILEGGAMEKDENVQGRWASLLANALTESKADVRTAFPTILSELEPADAALLDALAADLDQHEPSVIDVSQTTSGERASLDNLARLELVRYARATPTAFNNIDDPQARVSGVTLTAFGLEFLQACREPQPAD